MSKKKSFMQNFTWTFTGSLTYALSQWLLIVVLAKLGSPLIVGQFSLGLAITAPIILFFNMQLRNIIATDSVEEYSFAQYLGARIVLLAIALIIILLVAIIGPYSKSVSSVIILIGISKAVESLSELTHGYFQKMERMDYAGKSLVIKAMASLLTFTIIFFITKSLILALIGLNLAWIFRLFFYDIKIAKKYISVNPVYITVKSILLLALPLGFVSILNSLNTNIPRYVLERTIGLEQLGYFSAIAYLLIAGNLLIRPLSLVAAPRLAKSYQKQDLVRFVKITALLMCLGLILGVIILTIVFYLGEIILTVIYDDSYAEYNNIFFIIMVGSIISYFTTFLNVSIVAAREFKKQPYINFITMIVAILASIVFIPSHGIVGAAYVTVTVFITQFVGSLALFLYILKIKKHEKTREEMV